MNYLHEKARSVRAMKSLLRSKQGILVDESGWTSSARVLEVLLSKNYRISYMMLAEIKADNNSLFDFSEDSFKIRLKEKAGK